jgi:NAD(P)-dependent dehydrogenase (short-subunit alcohol dehydrogenase family)
VPPRLFEIGKILKPEARPGEVRDPVVAWLSKAALWNLVRSLARELQPQRVRVCTVTVRGEIKSNTAFIAEEFFAIANAAHIPIKS